MMVATLKAKSDEVLDELNALRNAKAKAAMVPAIGSIREKFEDGKPGLEGKRHPAGS